MVLILNAFKLSSEFSYRLWYVLGNPIGVYYLVFRFFNYCKKSILKYKKQPSRGDLRRRCCENMQQIYRRPSLPNSDFNKVVKELYWNQTSAWVFSFEFVTYFRNTFLSEHLRRVASEVCTNEIKWLKLYWRNLSDISLQAVFLENLNNIRKFCTEIKINFILDL